MNRDPSLIPQLHKIQWQHISCHIHTVITCHHLLDFSAYDDSLCVISSDLSHIIYHSVSVLTVLPSKQKFGLFGTISGSILTIWSKSSNVNQWPYQFTCFFIMIIVCVGIFLYQILNIQTSAFLSITAPAAIQRIRARSNNTFVFLYQCQLRANLAFLFCG